MKHLHNNLYVAGQISADDIKALAANGFTTIINNRPDHEESNQLTHTEAQALAAEHGLEYVYLPMANGQPLAESTVDDFKKIVDDPDKKVLAHCRSGMRSSVIWGLGAIAAGQVSVDEAISAAGAAGIPLQNARPLLESAKPRDAKT